MALMAPTATRPKMATANMTSTSVSPRKSERLISICLYIIGKTFNFQGVMVYFLCAEVCPSGLRSTLGKRVKAQVFRRFESSRFRQNRTIKK